MNSNIIGYMSHVIDSKPVRNNTPTVISLLRNCLHGCIGYINLPL